MLIYDVAFSAETDALKQQLAQLKREVDDMFKLDKLGNKPEAMFDPIKREGQAAAQFLQQALQKATSVDGTSLSRFNIELRKSGVSAEELAKRLSAAGMTDNLRALTTTIASADSKLTVFNDHIKEMHRVLKQSVKFRAAMAVQDFLVGQAQAAVQWTRDLNQNLVDIQVVSEKTGQQMERVFDTVIEKSKELSTTAKEYSAAALIYYQQGLPDEEVERRTDITIKAARAAGEEAEQMSKNLTAIWNTYQMSGDRLQNAASIAAKLGADTAVDFAYIAEAMQSSATAAAQMGLSYENLAAIIATVGETTMQASSVVGNAFKTIISRFDQLKVSGSDGEVTLGRISQQLADLGVRILDASGELKTMDQIIYETGDSWTAYSQKQQIAIAEVLGGTRQFGQVLALFNNWDKFLGNAATAFGETSADALESQFAVATQSINVLADQAAEAWQRAFANLANEDVLKDFYKLLRDLGDGVDTIIKGFGGVPGILTIIGVAFSKNILEKVFQAGTAIKNNIVDSFTAVGNRFTGNGPISGAMVAQQRTGRAMAAEQPEGSPERAHIDRQFDTGTLQHYEKLNKVIREGTEFEKAAAQAEKDRFTSLINSIYESEIKLKDLRQASLQAAETASVSGLDKQAAISTATAKIRLEATPEDVEAIKAELQAAFGKEAFDFEFKTDKPLSQINELNIALQNLIANFQSRSDIKMIEFAADATEAKESLGKLTAEYKIQEKAVKQLETRYNSQKDKLEALGATVDKRNKKYKEFKSTVEELGKQLAEATREMEATKKQMDDIGKTASDADKRVADLKAEMAEMSAPGVQQAADQFKAASNAANDYTSRLAELQQKQQEIGPALAMPNMLQAITSMGQAAMGIGMIGTAIGNLVTAFKEGEGVGDALLQLLMQLVFLGPMAAKGVMAYTAELKASIGVIMAKNAAVTMNNILAGQRLTAEAVLAAATQAGIKLDREKLMINGQLNAALLSKALANKGVTISETAMTGAVAGNTPVVAANAAAWWAHPIILIIAAAILAAVAVFALLDAAAKRNAEEARKSAEETSKQAQAFSDAQDAITKTSEALDKNEEAMKKSTKGTEKHNEAIEDTQETFDAIRGEIEKLDIQGLSTDVLRNAEAWALATGDMRDYREELERIQKELEKERLTKAQNAVSQNLYSAKENWAGGGFLNGSQVFSGHLFGTSDLDQAIYDFLWNSDYWDILTGMGKSLGGSVGLYFDLNWADPEEFVEDYQRLEQMYSDVASLAVQKGGTSDLVSGLRDRLDSIRGEYEVIRANLDEIRAIEGNLLYETSVKKGTVRDKSTVTDVAEYSAAIDELAVAYRDMGYSADEALSRARGQYRYFAAENSEIGRQLKEIQGLYDAIESAKDRGARFGIDRNLMDTAYQEKIAGNEERLEMFPRIDLRGFTGSTSEDLGEYFDKQIEYLETKDIIIKARLDLEEVYEAMDKLEKEGPEALRDMFDWQNYDPQQEFSKYLDFLKLTSDQQKEYLKSMAEQDVQEMNQHLQEEMVRLMNLLPPPNVSGTPDPQREEYAADIMRLINENQIDIKINLLKDANLSETLDELLSKLTTGRIEIEQFNAALETVGGKEAESYGLDADETIAYAKHLQEVAESSDLVNNSLAKNKKTAIEAAIAIQRLNRGIDKLAGGFKDWNDVLTESDEGSQEFFEAMEGMKDAMADVLNIDATDLSSKFITDNLKDIELASEGSVAALARLQLAAGKDIVLQFTATINDEQVVASVLGTLTNIQDYINDIPLEIRAEIDETQTAKLHELGQAFIQTASSAGMAAQDIAASLQAMGYNAKVVTKYEEGEIEVPTYTTYEESVPGGSMTAYNLDGTPYTLPLTAKKSYTVPGTPIKMKGIVPVTSVEIEGMSGSFGGNISNYSSKNPGGPPPGGTKGGGGGSKPKEKGKAPAAKDSVKERYANIENVISDVTRSIEKLNSAEEHTFGTDRLNAMLRKQKTLLKLASAQAAYAEEARRYYETDKSDFLVEIGDFAKFDEFGYLTNIEEVRQKWQNELDLAFAEWQAVYERLPEKLNEAQEAELKAAEERYNARKEFVDGEIEKLEQLLETETKVKEQIDAATETFREMMQSKLDEAQYKMDLKIQITEMDLRFIDYLAKRLDRAGASANKTSKFFENLNGTIKNLAQQSLAVTENVGRMYEIMNNIEDSSPHKGWFINELASRGYTKETATEIWQNFQDTGRMDAEILDMLMNDAEQLLEINEALFEAMYSAWDHYIETFQDFMEQFDKIIGRFDGLKDRINSINGLLAAFGMTATRNAQQVANLGVSFDISGRKMVVFKAKAEEAAAWAADAKNQLDYAMSTGDADLIAEAERAYDEMQQAADEAYDEYLASMKQFADDYVEIWGQMVDLIVANFSAKIFPLATSMETALESLDLQREVGNFWLDAYQSGYQYDRLLKKIAEDTESITDPAQRALYDEIQAEILAKQEAGALVTEKDVELWEKRLNVAKAQAAFEESLIAKNTMRLARDASGNWSYVYSTEIGDKEEADDKKAEAEYDYYTAVKDAIDDYSAKLRETEAASLAYYQERAKQRALINAEDTEALAKFDAETEAQMNRYTNLILWYAGKIDEYAGFIGLSHEEMALTITSGYNSATEEAMAYLNGIENTLVPELNAAETKMRDDAAYYLGQIGVSFETLATVAKREMDTIKKEAESLSTKLQGVQQQSQKTLQQMSEDMRKLSEDWVGYIKAMIEANEALYQSIQNTVTEKSGADMFNMETDYARLIGQAIEAENIKNFKGEDSAKALAAIINTPEFKALIAQRDAKMAAMQAAGTLDPTTPSTQALLNAISRGNIGWDNGMGQWVYWDETERTRKPLPWEDLLDWIMGGVNHYATGGLVPGTGDKDSELGALTPGEYVLNPADTREFFKTFQAFLAYPTRNNDLSTLTYGQKALEQMIQIYADFPNVSSRDEIQAALNNLINQAKQYNV